MQQIHSFGVFQTAKVMGLLSFIGMAVVTAILVPYMMVLQSLNKMPLFTEGLRSFLLLVVVVPPLYASLAFIGTAIGCVIYNRIARWVGGVAVELRPSGTVA